MLIPLNSTGKNTVCIAAMVLGVCILFACSTASRFNNPGTTDSMPRLSEFEFLAASQQAISFDAVRSADWDKTFKPHATGFFRFGILDTPVWIRARMPVFGQNATRPVLTINSPGIKEADLYLPIQTESGIAWRHLTGGLIEKPSPQDWGYRFMVYDLPDRTAAGQWLYFRINAGGHTANFTMALVDPGALRHITWMEMVILNICIGILMGMILYNASLYLFLRDNNHLLYVVYISFMFAYQVCHSGMGRMAGMPLLINASIPVSAITYISALAFARQFLDTKRSLRGFHYGIYLMMALSAAALVLWATGNVGTANRFTHTLGLLCPLFMVIMGITRMRQGFAPARYYLAAWLTLCFSIIVLVLVGFKIIPYNFMTYNAHTLGSAAESILLSMALGDRMRMIRRERKRLQEHERRLTRLSITDELTGLFNKRGYAAKLPLEIKLARKNNWALSLLILDVDHFKSFNDTYGHAAGDKVLAAVGKIIAQSTRDNDIPCRYGGEEFVVILPGIPLKEAGRIAERLRREVENSPVAVDGGKRAGCTISVGISRLSLEDTEASFFERADTALYTAKKNGRNRVIAA